MCTKFYIIEKTSLGYNTKRCPLAIKMLVSTRINRYITRDPCHARHNVNEASKDCANTKMCVPDMSGKQVNCIEVMPIQKEL